MTAALCLLLALSAADAGPGLAGTWRLDPAKSDLSGGMREAASVEQTLIIDVAGNAVTVKTSTKTTVKGSPGMNRNTTDHFEVDGARHPFTPSEKIGSGNADGKRTAKWLPNQRGLDVQEQVTRDMMNGTFTVENTHRWVLSEDGAVLTIESITQGPLGQIHTRRVLTRQVGRRGAGHV